MSDPHQWHRSAIPFDGQQVLILTRRCPDGWDWKVELSGKALHNDGGLSKTQEAAVSAALRGAASDFISRN